MVDGANEASWRVGMHAPEYERQKVFEEQDIDRFYARTLD